MSLDVLASARMLGVSPDTLRRWARQGLLGMRAPGGELCFERPELEAWARRHGLSLREALAAPAAESSADSPGAIDPRPFLGALQRGGIHRRIPAADRDEALATLVELAPLRPEADRGALLEQLLAREQLASTGLGRGVALPHPRSPGASFVLEPTLVLAGLAAPVDWAALDGLPVHSVILLLGPSPPAHLAVLARAAYLLRDEEFCRLLACGAGAGELLARVDLLEPRQG